MKIGILQTGVPPQPLVARFGRYDAMIERLLGEGFRATTIDVASGSLPKEVEQFDGYVITGSSAGVYDPLPWIEPLKDFLRRAQGRARLVGICFGHQVMAEAFGGKVEKSAKGWGIGLHSYEIYGRAGWMGEPPSEGAARIAVPASHQDQVVELPPGAEMLGGSAFTPYGILSYPDRRAISVQFHPEFEPAFAKALIELRRSILAEPGLTEQAIASLRQVNDRERVAGWIRRFLREG